MRSSAVPSGDGALSIHPGSSSGLRAPRGCRRHRVPRRCAMHCPCTPIAPAPALSAPEPSLPSCSVMLQARPVPYGTTPSDRSCYCPDEGFGISQTQSYPQRESLSLTLLKTKKHFAGVRPLSFTPGHSRRCSFLLPLGRAAGTAHDPSSITAVFTPRSLQSTTAL